MHKNVFKQKNSEHRTQKTLFDEFQINWAKNKESNSRSLLSNAIFFAYRFNALRKYCIRLANKLENGVFFSQTLRKIFKQYHGVTVGSYSYGPCFSPGVFPRGSHVGAYCSIAGGLKVFRRNHPINTLTQHPFFYNHKLGLVKTDTINADTDNPLTIGSDVWIGERVTIMPSCKMIADGAVIGAGSIVTKDVKACTIVAGNPAKLIKTRFTDSDTENFLDSKWWELSLSDLLSSEYFSLIKSGKE